jgi:hypothetical protein
LRTGEAFLFLTKSAGKPNVEVMALEASSTTGTGP